MKFKLKKWQVCLYQYYFTTHHEKYVILPGKGAMATTL